MKWKATESFKPKATRGERRSIAALKHALEAMPTYGSAIVSMGSVEYQAGRIAEGLELFQSLLSLPKNTRDICQIVDEAGRFLTGIGADEDGMPVYRTAVKRDPDVPRYFKELDHCASNAGLREEAVSANQRALNLDPENRELVNDLDWTLVHAGRFMQARESLR